MRTSQEFRACLVGLMALAGAGISSTAHADNGTVRLTVVKAGYFIGGSGGSGTLTFQGKTYPLKIGGVSAGLVFGASGTRYVGTVSHIRRPSDVAGVYGAAGAGAAVAVGVAKIILKNEKGAVLELSGKEIGLMANLDVSGLAIGLH
jgi:hypothetical protein